MWAFNNHKKEPVKVLCALKEREMCFRLGVTYLSLSCFSSSVSSFNNFLYYYLLWAPFPQSVLPITSEFIPMNVYAQVFHNSADWHCAIKQK